MSRGFFTNIHIRRANQATLEQELSDAFDKYSDMLYRHALLRVSNAEQAEDLMQDTFMKCWDYACKHKKVSNWRALLYKIINNLIIDYYRKKKSSSLDMLLEKEGVNDGSFTDLIDEPNIAEQIDMANDIKILKENLNKLQQQDKDIVILRMIDKLSAKEVAKLLNITPNSVHVRLHRALKMLKVYYKDTVL